jgi:hypothetical protein
MVGAWKDTTVAAMDAVAIVIDIDNADDDDDLQTVVVPEVHMNRPYLSRLWGENSWVHWHSAATADSNNNDFVLLD